jgi:molybdate transport system regulatory protein
MKLAYKVWLDNDGKAFGEGPYRTAQARQGNRLSSPGGRPDGDEAWLSIRASERRLGIPLLERTVGGASGGGSHITAAGPVFIEKYERFRNEVSKTLEQAYDKRFQPG